MPSDEHIIQVIDSLLEQATDGVKYDLMPPQEWPKGDLEGGPPWNRLVGTKVVTC
jgi:hypothetical protein